MLCRLHEQGQSIGNVNIYAYEAWSSIPEDFSWEALFNYGHALVNLLATRQNSNNVAEVGHESAKACGKHSNLSQHVSLRPIILMAHSLAGFIVKQVQNSLNQCIRSELTLASV